MKRKSRSIRMYDEEWELADRLAEMVDMKRGTYSRKAITGELAESNMIYTRHYMRQCCLLLMQIRDQQREYETDEQGNFVKDHKLDDLTESLKIVMRHMTLNIEGLNASDLPIDVEPLSESEALSLEPSEEAQTNGG